MDSSNINNNSNNKYAEKNSKAAKRRYKRGASEGARLFRLLVGAEAHEVLEGLVSRVNNGFDGGEVTKSDIVSWLLLQAGKSFSDSEVRALRHLHFDERRVLTSLLRKSDEDAELPEEIRKAIRDHYGLSEIAKKRTSRMASEAV